MAKALIVYYSMYGNTEKVAKALAQGLTEGGVEAESISVESVKLDQLGSYDLLAFGSPIHAWNISKPMKDFLERLKTVDSLTGKKAFAFDTKAGRSRLAGDAAGKIEGKLKSLGMSVVKAHESAFVKGREGPLEEGAEEQFRKLGAELAKTL